MSEYYLSLKLKSDATFGRGDGVVGLVDAEVEHDELGLPFLRGRALKGLLREECANILFSLEQQGHRQLDEWRSAAEGLFGKPGSSSKDDARMRVGDAVLPEDLRDAVRFALNDSEEHRLKTSEILESLTAIRRQTAMEANGAPKENSLRSIRVVLRETEFISELSFDFDPRGTKEFILLGACAASLQRAGLGRNRGRGRIEVRLNEHADITSECLQELHAMLAAKEATQ